MEDGYVGLFGAIVFLFALLFGFSLGTFETDKMLKDCMKTNNVYQCEIIARPVK